MKTITASLNGIRHSPRKMRVVIDTVKDLPIPLMLEQLTLTRKKAAQYIYKALKSALANAKNNFQLNENEVRLKEMQAGDARKVRKPKFRARGRMDVARIRYSNLLVVLESLKEDKEEVKVQKVEESKTEKVASQTDKKKEKVEKEIKVRKPKVVKKEGKEGK